MPIRYTGVSKINSYIEQVCVDPVKLGMALRIEFDRIYELIAGTARRVTGTITSDYTVRQSDDVLLVNAATGIINITLPNAKVLTGELIIIKTDISANAVRLTAVGLDTIEGATTYDITSQYETAVLMPDATKWYVLSRRT